jgi:hypothetical protein
VPALDAVLRPGRLHPDEVFQALEPALRLAFGYGLEMWEWQVGLRNLAVPGLFAGLLRLAHAVGIDDAQARRAVLEVPQALLHLAMLGAVYRFSWRRVGDRAARWAVVLVGLFGPLVWFAGRTMSEALSTAFLAWGLERLDAALEDGRWWPPLAGGLLLGLAEIARYGSAAAILPALAFLAVTRRWRTLLLVIAGGAAMAFALGLLDRLTWGGWFHSLAQYVDFNLTSGKAAQGFGVGPWWAFIPRLTVAPFAAVGLWRWRVDRAARSWLFFAVAAGYFLTISAVPHKESRFVYPALVLLTIAGAPAFARFALDAWTGRRRGALAVAVLAAGPGTASFYLVTTAFDLQQPELFALTMKAGRTGRGLLVLDMADWNTGGYFSLGRELPFCTSMDPGDECFARAAGDPRFDRAILMEDRREPARATAGRAALEAAGFGLAEHRGAAWYFERPAP